MANYSGDAPAGGRPVAARGDAHVEAVFVAASLDDPSLYRPQANIYTGARATVGPSRSALSAFETGSQ